MKFFKFLPLAFLAACGSGEDSALHKKMQQRDSLLTVIDELKAKVSDLNEEIALLDTSQGAGRSAIPVMVQKLEKDTFNHYFEVQGVVEADKNILISPETAGMVKQVLVEEGQTVSKGQTLLVLDTEVLQRSIEEVQTSYLLAEEVFKRQENLWKQKIGTEIQFIEAKSRKESLEKTLKTLQAQMSKSVIKAPEDGVIDEVFPKVGELAAPQMPVVRLVNTEKVYIKSDVSEQYLTKVMKGQEVTVKFPSLNEEKIASVTSVGNFINPGSRTFKITVNLDNKDEQLKPNLLAVIKIRDFKGENVVTVPSDHVLSDAEGKQYVFVAEKKDGKTVARKVEIETGMSYNGKTIVKSGLQGGEEFITEGSRSVTNGEFIIIKN